MTAQQPSAPPRARSGPSGPGIVHVTERHHERFTVVGNHLAQHPELSLMAIGLATHIQSLPKGTPVGIKALAARFPEGEIRIAAALRELEAHGYLARIKERLPSGRVVTRTISYNRPRLATSPAAAPASVTPVTRVAPVVPVTPVGAPDALDPKPAPPSHRPAVDLLSGLRAHDSRLLLTKRDVHRLAPAVAAWLERGVPASAVQRTLMTDLPQEPIRHPARFLAHRLAALLPPPLPTAPHPQSTAPRGSLRPDPLQTCDGCERAFRAPSPGRCRDCRSCGAAA
ncbi:helix-turn-helix domain-containing protein [Streptomyces sp. NBC_01615]|uniref:helix-turn-helix domain-containing protein n=1 Tax=Streptomyces sp. NBC_01615 TaxID=2975898 RepID=UPI00386C7AF1